MSSTNGSYINRINGTYHHAISDLIPQDPQKPSFSQIFIYDSDFQTNYRSSMFKDKIDQNILILVQSFLFEHNPYFVT
ncbi:helitron helicase [Brachionus plicatilis]|uniref:Helitron helicase n=1 Tax=Brachionus plicatilis TaxID=10195 RepID=A0A3M7RN74_BRAPC|nr:helitron helicase [Brachionus plicatilis]